jgi:uncharacterized membrane protein YozB (DUF420 family)
MENIIINSLWTVWGFGLMLIPLIVNKFISRSKDEEIRGLSIYGSNWSIQKIFIIGVIVFLVLLPWVTTCIFKDFDNISNDKLEYLLSLSMNSVYALVGGFGIVLTILWGSLYGFYTEHKYKGELYKMKGQSVTLISILIWLLVSIFGIIIYPILNKYV